MRGTVDDAHFIRDPKRITPACAGNSNQQLESAGKDSDHPRVCGEQTALSLDMRVEGGSPPRVRGTGLGYDAGKVDGRITPACAGNSTAHQANNPVT